MRGSLRPVARMNRSPASAMSAAANNNSGKAIKDTVRFITDSSLWAKKRSQARLSPRAATLRHYLIDFVLPVAVLVPVIVVVAVTVDMMHINGDAAVGAPADSRSHGCRVTTGTDHCRWRHLGHEDAVALGVGSYRVRVLRLRDLLNEEIRIRIDHAEGGTAGGSWTTPRFSAGPAGTQVVAPIARVVPDLVRAGDVPDLDEVLGLRVDDLRGRIGGNVLRRAAEHQVAMRSHGGAVRSAIAQR